MDKLTAMRSFVAVMNAGSFSKAAAALGVPKTRVSQRVQELEAALKVRLLYRTTRVLSPTEEGRIYFEKCLQILEDVDATEAAIARKQEAPSGRLRVSCMSLVARTLLLPRLAEFRALYPDVRVTMSVSDRIANLNEAGFDCAFRGGELESSSLISRHLGDFSFGLYAAPGWLARQGPLRQPSDLAAVARIMVTRQQDGLARPWELSAPGGLCRVEGPGQVEVDDDHAAIEAAIGGAGVLLCPDFSTVDHVRAGRLVRVLPEWSGASRPIYFIYPTRSFLAAKLRCFMDWSTGLVRGQG